MEDIQSLAWRLIWEVELDHLKKKFPGIHITPIIALKHRLKELERTNPRKSYA